MKSQRDLPLRFSGRMATIDYLCNGYGNTRIVQHPTTHESMPPITSLRSNFLFLEESTAHDEFEHDGPGYLSTDGPRHDNDHVNIQDIQILPTTDEILAVQRLPYLPRKNIAEPNHLEPGPQRLLDMLFRHLRYDSVERIRQVSYHAAQLLIRRQDTAISGDVETRQETHSGHRYFLYSGVTFEEFLSDERRGVILRLSYSCPQSMRGRGMIRSGRLEAGMLCALIGLEEDQNQVSVTFFEVYMTQSTDSMRARGGRGVRAAVQLAFPRPTKHHDVQRILRYAQGLSSGRFVLVEFPKLLYAGFSHCLNTLQCMESTEMAFSKYIAPRAAFFGVNSALAGVPTLLDNPTISPPAYSNVAGFRFNVGCLAQIDATFSLAELLDTSGAFIRFLKQNTTLDIGQAWALRDCLSREVAFIQGPPGTGKTFLGVALSRVLLASRLGTNRKPILVVCLTNHALDSFLAGLLDAGVTKIARIGRGSKEDWTKKIELHALSRNTKLAQGVWGAKNNSVRHAQALFADIEALCKGLNAESSTGFLSWPTVKAHLRATRPQMYEQLTTSNDNPYARSFAFDYWAGGGDLRNLQGLRLELESCLLGTSATEGASISTASIDLALEKIMLHIQQQSARAEKNNIWKLNLEGRQQMLLRWKAEIDREKLVEDFAKLHMDHQAAGQAIRKSWQKRDAKCLLEQDVIGLTTTACASNWEMLKTLDLEIVICEEAGQVMESHTLCSLFPSLQQAIFIGDPQQLRPEVNEFKMSLETSIGSNYRLNESLFERCMIPTDPNSRAMPTSCLNIQRRMHPDIADLTRLVYPYLQDHPHTILHPSTDGIAERMFWVDHRAPEAEPSATYKSHVNTFEVAMVTGIVRYLIQRIAYSLGDIAILTPYNGQLAALHDSLKTTCSVWLSDKDRQALLDDGLLEDSKENRPRSKDSLNMSDLLRIATVDNFQGEEAKIVILSTVRSGGRPGFLKTMNRINVACSRAKGGFYIVGNSETLGQVPPWRRIIEVFASRGRIGPALRTCCSRHPDHYTDICKPHEFDQVRECDMVCGAARPCGHLCQERCHPPELHERQPCMYSCNKFHPCGHQCSRLCSEACGTCHHLIEQKLLACGHAVDVFCSGGIPICTQLMDASLLPCGHQNKIRCCDRDKAFDCGESCGQNLPCGHICRRLCADCRGSTVVSHQPCSNKCGAKLQSCGHYCDSECHHGAPCPPCKQPCQERCEHGSCQNICSDSCEPCVRLHTRHCIHQVQSPYLCSLPSNILPCGQRCERVLPCGHACPSPCGEVCPEDHCSQCASGMPHAASVLVCPTCRHLLDTVEWDRRLISKIYTIDNSGNITGFAPNVSSWPYGLTCICGAFIHKIRRYSILKQVRQAPTVVIQLVRQLGRSVSRFSRQIHHQEKELEDSFDSFCSQIRPNPLAGAHNRALVTSRAHELLRISDRIQEFNTSTASTFERSVSWLQTALPAALVSITDRTIQPTISIRLTILHRRARNIWIFDCLRVSRFLVALKDPSLEVQRMGEVLRTRASEECWKGIAECEDALKVAMLRTAPAIEVEIRLQQIQLSHLLDIAFAGDVKVGAPVLAMTPQPSSESLRKAMQLCKQFPDSAGKFASIVTSFGSYFNKNKCASMTTVPSIHPSALSSLPRTCNYKTRGTELTWGEDFVDSIEMCERGGHPFRRQTNGSGVEGCPECGREISREVKIERMAEEIRRARDCLFEDKFLEAMKGRGR